MLVRTKRSRLFTKHRFLCHDHQNMYMTFSITDCFNFLVLQTKLLSTHQRFREILLCTQPYFAEALVSNPFYSCDPCSLAHFRFVATSELRAVWTRSTRFSRTGLVMTHLVLLSSQNTNPRTSLLSEPSSKRCSRHTWSCEN